MTGAQLNNIDNQSELFLEKFLPSLFNTLVFLIILADFYLMYVQVGPFPPRNYLCAVIAPFCLVDLKRNGIKNFVESYFPTILFLSVIFLYMALYYLFHGAFETKIFLKDILKYGTLGFALNFLLQRVKLDFVFKSVSIILGISAFFAILQFFKLPYAWDLRIWLKKGYFYNAIMDGSMRPSGLAYFAMTFSEQIVLFIPLLFHNLIKKRNIKILGIASLLGFIFVLMLNNRGLTLSYLVTAFYFIFMHKKEINFKKLGIALGVALLALIFLNQFFRIYSFESHNDLARIDSFRLSFALAMENWFLGLGPRYNLIGDYFVELSKTMSGLHRTDLIGVVTPHNYLINTFFKYGLPGLTAALVLFSGLFFKGNVYAKVFIACTFFISQFHNGGITNTSTYFLGYLLFWAYFRKPEEEIN